MQREPKGKSREGGRPGPSASRPSSPRRPSKGGVARKPGAGGGGASRKPRTTGARPSATVDVTRDPQIPEDVTVEELDRSLVNELRTLPEGLAETVGRHLAAARRLLNEDDLDLAAAHVAAARRRAGRVPAVRETAGVIAYLQGRYGDALSELRTARRMTGSVELVPMIADCERALGRPQQALDLVRSIDAAKLDADVRVELLLVAAGARADMGNADAAVVTLQVPDLTNLPTGAARARLQLGYAEFLLAAGRPEEARSWMERAAASDVEGVTSAGERLDELSGHQFLEEPHVKPPADPASG